MTVRQYSTPLAFKQALEQRLRSASATGTDFGRRRLVLELRLERARTTKDVDLRMMGSPADVLELLQEAGRLDLGDHMRFEIQPDDEHPEIQNEGMRYEGYRYRAECRLAGMIYGRPFGVDVAFGDPLTGEPDVIQAEDTLSFAGIAPPAIRLYPVVTHIAEKLHALTMPRPRPNTRVRDLPDIALLATTGPIEGAELRRAIQTTFAHRGTHSVPASVPEPPDAWSAPYAAMATSDELPWATLPAVAAAVSRFLNPVLGLREVAGWDPSRWQWD